jgi:DNA-binding transcriptional MerR regulator
MSEPGEWPNGIGEHADETGDEPSTRLKKSPSAFRTISEVADDLHIPQHVLRFWETRFPQVKPLKRGGGRRYYRPDDIALLRRISDLLYIQGYTIKGVQRLLREGDGTLTGVLAPPEVAGRDDDDELPATAQGWSPEAAPPADAGPSPSDGEMLQGELDRLRGVLRHVLAELERLREQLPA